jgi:uncharacterized protein YndB with AHSA1/START domain
VTSAKIPIAPVRKSVSVSVDPPQAFKFFTQNFAEWWPLSTHSVALESAASLTFPAAVGDQIVETMADGTTSIWGTVLEVEAARRVAFSWHPGRSSDLVTHVEVTFTADPTGGTVVELVHSGWEQWEDGATQAVGYHDGWGVVLQAFVRRANVAAN